MRKKMRMKIGTSDKNAIEVMRMERDEILQ